MNRLPSVAVIALMLALCAGLGCANSDFGYPTAPGVTSEKQAASAESNRALWGMWQVAINGGTGDVDIVPLRGPMFNCNVQQFLSPPFVPTHNLRINLLPGCDFTTGYIECEVSLTHPFLGLEVYKGFDVRGIFMADGSKPSDHDPDMVYGCEETGEAHMLNADGYTRWWNATEFTDKMPILSYKPGKMGNLLYPTATLNPFKYFADDLDAEEDVADLDTGTRGVFRPAASPNKREYYIQFPMSGPTPMFFFNYAVDASWDEPDPEYAPEYPVEAFSLSAQCQEAYYVRLDDEGSDVWYEDGNSGGKLVLNVEVFDWQGPVNPSGVPGEIAGIWVESPILSAPVDIFPIATAAPGLATSSVFTAEINSTEMDLTAAGSFPLLGSVLSLSPDSYQPQIPGGEAIVHPDGPLAAYFMGSISISDESPTSGPTVTAIEPDHGELELSYEGVEVTGEGFQDGADVKLVKDTVVIDATNEVVTGSTLITCDIDLDSQAGAEVGFYDVVVTNPDLQEGQLDDGFEVVSVPCAPNEWGDNFESYPLGSYPSNNWQLFWSGVSAYVTDEQAYSGTQSFRQEAWPYWARHDGLPVSLPGHSYVCYEARAMITDASKRALMGFAWKNTSSTTRYYGRFDIGGTEFPETYQWYHVLAKISLIDETWQVWVDGELVRDGDVPHHDPGQSAVTHFVVGLHNFSTGGTSVGFFDDVWLYWDD